ncbi:MAG TPA: tRNA (adenosine(37)-N6)-dimethylallyltransferase MiaA [Bacteroidales bacterium]|nr:tRNA (adenosine(37)-N6)-dimethylallyltransferase MiaA [Bacteroidales bacterium]
MSSAYDLLVITGPTASGKTSLAAHLAKKLEGEVVSADSRQVYRGMDIGTGKDFDDYIIDGVKVPCHLLDIADPGYKYNLFEFQRDFKNVYSDLKLRGVFPVVCGGSGMYVDSIIKGYELFEVPPNSDLRAMLAKKSMEELKEILATYKTLHNTTDIDTKKRVIRAIEIEHFSRNKKAESKVFPQIRSLVVGVMTDRDERRKRISERLKKRLAEGMVEEVKGLILNGVKTETLLYYGLEYKYITLYLMNKLSYEEMFEQLEIAIHQFAKRQMTWFRGMERRGTKINWIDGALPMEEKVKVVLEMMI